MDTREITDILKRDRFTRPYFRGVFACNQLPKQHLPRPSVLVVNTDPSDKPGQHWVGIYIDQNGVGEYFDSYGQPPKVLQITRFLQKNTKHCIYNARHLQGPFSTVCGQYVIFFHWHRCRDLSMTKITQLFSSDTEDNDFNVNDFVRKHYPRSKPQVYDENFIIQQFARAYYNA